MTSDLLRIYDDYSPVIDLAALLLAVILQHRYQVINRIGKMWAKLRNRPTELTFQLEYTALQAFPQTKSAIKGALRTRGPITVIQDTESRMDVSTGIFRVAIIEGADGNIVLAFDRTSSGINDLHDHVRSLLNTVGSIARDQSSNAVLGSLVYCDLKFVLPYRWEHLVITTPRKAKLDSYTLSLSHESSSRINVTEGGIHVKATRTDALHDVLDTLL